MPQELPVSVAAAKRRATRSFKADAIPEEFLQKILHIAHTAPSSFNLQPTRIIVIKSKEQKEALSQIAWKQKQIVEAPVTLVFAVSIRGWEKNMEKMISIALKSGVWTEERGDYVRQNAPAFQNALGAVKEREYAIKDAMISATMACLQAEALGLSTCYMNGWDENGVKRIIGAENNPDIAIALLLPIGYSSITPENPGRLPQNEIIFTDRLTRPVAEL